MTIDEFKLVALDTIKSNPGFTRMEWFNACCKTDKQRNTLWHTFKFHVALVLVLDGQVKADGDNFFHISHNTKS